MNRQRLWAPWRSQYFKIKKKEKGCVFCRAAKDKNSAYLIFKSDYALCILNIYPYNNGHVMICPLRHVANLGRLKEKELIDLMRAVIKAKNLLKKVLKPQGFNIGINLGSFAGAGIVNHLHIHIVPRWKGDTNFMTVLENTRVLGESLETLTKKLKNELAKKT